MKMFSLKKEAKKMEMFEKLTLIEAVASTANSILYVEPILRVVILKEVAKKEIDLGDVIKVYKNHDLDNLENTLKYVCLDDYENMLRLSEERFKELQMTVDMETIKYLQEAVDKNGAKS